MTAATREPREIAGRYAQAWNDHELAATMDLHTTGTRYQLHGGAGPAIGQEVTKDTCLGAPR